MTLAGVSETWVTLAGLAETWGDSGRVDGDVE